MNLGTKREVSCLGFRHSPGPPHRRLDYIQLLLKLGFSGTETHFLPFEMIKHMSQSRAHLDGEVGRKMVLEKLRISYFVAIASEVHITT